MKKIFVLLSVILLFNSVYSNNNDAKLKLRQANELYASGNYFEASKIYKEIDSMGYQSFELYYNAGNAFYRINEIGLSIYYYEKANLLNPANEDLLHNLELANLRVKELPAEVPELSVISFLKKIIDYGSVKLWGIVSILTFLLFLTFLFFYFKANSVRSKKIRFLFSILFFIFSFITVLFTSYRFNKINSEDLAVVISDEVKGNSSPDETSTVLFRLFEGYKVTIEAHSKDWIEIKLTDGKKAWIKKEHVKIL